MSGVALRGEAAAASLDNNSSTPVLSTTPTGTPRITPAPLHPVKSTHLQHTAPTPAPTRTSSVVKGANPETSAAPNDLIGQGYGNADNKRASSISEISALSIPPYKLQDYNRTIDRFEMSSEDEDEDPSSTPTYGPQGSLSKESNSANNRPQNRYTPLPRTSASANTTEAPTSPRDAEIRGVTMAGLEHTTSIPSSIRGVKSLRGESVSSIQGKGSRHGSGSTADSGNGQRRGSEAKSWEEVHAARREATAAVKLVDLTNAAQAQSNQGVFRRYPSSSTHAIKSPASDSDQPPVSVVSMNRYPSTSTRAIKSPNPGDDLTTPTTAGLSQASPTDSIQRYPSSSTRAMKSPHLGASGDDLGTPRSTFSIATDTTSGRAEKGLHVPFLPKFLRLTVGRTSSDTASRSSNDNTPTKASHDSNRKGSNSSSAGRKSSTSSSTGRGGSIHVASNGEPLTSVFEDDDTVDYDDHAEISNATTATAARPKVVRQSASGREIVGLKEILKEDPTATVDGGTGNASPTKSKVARFLGESVRFGGKRQGIVGMPIAREAKDVTLPTVAGREDAIGLGIYEQSGPATNYADGLRSNPVRRAATTPARRERKVTFPPPPVDIQTGGQPEERQREQREVSLSQG